MNRDAEKQKLRQMWKDAKAQHTGQMATYRFVVEVALDLIERLDAIERRLDAPEKGEG